MDRKQKLEALGARNKKPSTVELSSVITAALEQLKAGFQEGIELHGYDELLEALKVIPELTAQVKDLQIFIAEMKLPEMPESVKVENLTGVLEAIKAIKVEAPAAPDYSPIEAVAKQIKALVEVTKADKASQKPTDFLPYRRVIKEGSLWRWDDTPTPSNTGVASGGGVGVVTPFAPTSTVTSASAAEVSTQLLAANANRKQFLVFNDSSAIMYLKFGANASTTSYTTKVGAGILYESYTTYQGVISAVWASATGAARVTEVG